MSNKWQPYMAEALGFKPWIRSVTPVDTAALEDVSEAFVAALSNVADMYKTFGYGIRLCKKFVYFVTQNIDYEESELYGDEKRRIGQRLEKYIGGQDLGRIEEIIIGSGPTLAVTLTLRKDVSDRMIEDGFKMNPGNVIGIGKNPILESARRIAYAQADKFFTDIGFTQDFVDNSKSDKVWSKLRAVNETLVRQVESKLKREGYTKPVFDNKTKGTGLVKFAFLNAKDTDNNLKRLGLGKNEDLIKAQIAALQEYIES
jgi:hypothetical protein